MKHSISELLAVAVVREVGFLVQLAGMIDEVLRVLTISHHVGAVISKNFKAHTHSIFCPGSRDMD